MNKQVTNFSNFTQAFTHTFVFERMGHEEIQTMVKGRSRKSEPLSPSVKGIEEVKRLIQSDLEAASMEAFNFESEDLEAVLPLKAVKNQPTFIYQDEEWVEKMVTNGEAVPKNGIAASNKVLAATYVANTTARLLRGDRSPKNALGESINKSATIYGGFDHHQDWIENVSLRDVSPIWGWQYTSLWGCLKSMPYFLDEAFIEENALLVPDENFEGFSVPLEHTSFLKGHHLSKSEYARLSFSLFSVRAAEKNPKKSFLVWEELRSEVVEYFGSERKVPSNLYFTDFWTETQDFDWDISYQEIWEILKPLAEATKTGNEPFSHYLRLEDNGQDEEGYGSFTLWFEENYSLTIKEKGRQVLDDRGRFIQKMLVTSPMAWLPNKAKVIDPAGLRTYAESDLTVMKPFGILLNNLLAMMSYVKGNNKSGGSYEVDRLARKDLASAPFWCAEAERRGTETGTRHEYELGVVQYFNMARTHKGMYNEWHPGWLCLQPRFSINKDTDNGKVLGVSPLTSQQDGKRWSWKAYCPAKGNAASIADKAAMRKFNYVRMHKGSQNFCEADIFHTPFHKFGDVEPVKAFTNVLLNLGAYEFVEGESYSPQQILFKVFGIVTEDDKEAVKVIEETATFVTNSKIAKGTKRASLWRPTSGKVLKMAEHILNGGLGNKTVVMEYGTEASGSTETYEVKALVTKSIDAPGQSVAMPSLRFNHPFQVPLTYKLDLEGFAFRKDENGHQVPAIDVLYGNFVTHADEETVEYAKDSAVERQTMAKFTYEWTDDITVDRPDGLGQSFYAKGCYVQKGTLVAKMSYTQDGKKLFNDIYAPEDMVIEKLIFQAEKSGNKIRGLSAKLQGFEVQYLAKLRGELKTIPVLYSNGEEVVYNSLNEGLVSGVELVTTLDATKSFTDVKGSVETMAQSAAHTEAGRMIIQKINEVFFDRDDCFTLYFDEAVAALGGYDVLQEFCLRYYSRMLWTKKRAPQGEHLFGMLLPLYESFAANTDDWTKLEGEDKARIQEWEDGRLPEDTILFISEASPEELDYAKTHVLAFYKEGDEEVLCQKTLSLVGNKEAGHVVCPLKPELSSISQMLSISSVLPNVAATVESGAGNGAIKPNPELARYLTQGSDDKPKRWAAFSAMYNRQDLYVEINGKNVVLPTVPLFVEQEVNPEFLTAIREFDHGRLSEAAKFNRLTLKELSDAFPDVVLDDGNTYFHLPTLFQQEGEPVTNTTMGGQILGLFKHLLNTDKNIANGVRYYTTKARSSMQSLVESSQTRKMRGASGVYGKVAASDSIPINEIWVFFSEKKKSYYQYLKKAAELHGMDEGQIDGMRVTMSRMPMPYACGLKVRVIYPGQWTTTVTENSVDTTDTDFIMDSPVILGEVKQQRQDRLNVCPYEMDVMNELQPLVNPMTAYVDAGDWDGDDRLVTPVNPLYADVELISYDAITSILAERTGTDPLSFESDGSYIADHFNGTPSSKKQWSIGGNEKHLSFTSRKKEWKEALKLSFKGSPEELLNALQELERDSLDLELLYKGSTEVQGQAVGTTHKIANISSYLWGLVSKLSPEQQKLANLQYDFLNHDNWNLVGFELYENPLGGFGWEIYRLIQILQTGQSKDKKKKFTDFFDVEKLVKGAGLNAESTTAMLTAAQMAIESYLLVTKKNINVAAYVSDLGLLCEIISCLIFAIDKGQLDLETSQDLVYSDGYPQGGSPAINAVLLFLSFDSEVISDLKEKSLIVDMVDQYIKAVLPAHVSHLPEWNKFLYKKGLLGETIKGNRVYKGVATPVSLSEGNKHIIPEVNEKQEVPEEYSLEEYHKFLLKELRTGLPKSKFGSVGGYVDVLNGYIAPLISELSEDQVGAVHKFFFGQSSLFALSGAGGTGKSYVTGAIVEILRHCTHSDTVLSASSGTAAKNLSSDAMTFGRLSGQGIEPISPLGVENAKHVNPANLARKLVKRVNADLNAGKHVVMVIDEISMLSAEQLWVFFETARLAFNANFGQDDKQYPEKFGFTVLGVGDMPQLSPVEGSESFVPCKFNIDGEIHSRPSVFDFYKADLAGLYINHRVGGEQGEFVKQLIEVSEGEAVEAHSPIGERVLYSIPQEDSQATAMFLSNKEAKEYNAKLSKEFFTKGSKGQTYPTFINMKGKSWRVLHVDHNMKYASLSPVEGGSNWNGHEAYQAVEFLPPWVEPEMTLYEGMSFMIRENDHDGSRWANGSVGTILEVREHSIVLDLEDQEVELQPETSVATVKVNNQVVKSFTGLLGHPAHAMTVQKSQGLTFSEGKINVVISNPEIAASSPGLVYVALSRVKSVDQLNIVMPNHAYNPYKALNESISASAGAVQFRKDSEQALKEYVGGLSYSSDVQAFPVLSELDFEHDEEMGWRLSTDDGLNIIFDKESGEYILTHDEVKVDKNISFSSDESADFISNLKEKFDEEVVAEIKSVIDFFKEEESKKVIDLTVDYTYAPADPSTLAGFLHNEVSDNAAFLTGVKEAEVSVSVGNDTVTFSRGGDPVTVNFSKCFGLSKAKVLGFECKLKFSGLNDLAEGIKILKAVSPEEGNLGNVIRIDKDRIMPALQEELECLSEDTLLSIHSKLKSGELLTTWVY